MAHAFRQINGVKFVRFLTQDTFHIQDIYATLKVLAVFGIITFVNYTTAIWRPPGTKNARLVGNTLALVAT